jgi:hypothetical protein
MWTSKHIFIHDYQLIEIFLKDYLFPYIDRQTLSYFFIRYWDGGPHIRLRYKNQAENFEEGIEKLMMEFQMTYKDHPFQEVSYDAAIVETEEVQPAAPFPNFSVQTIDYVPELYRYGGADVMDLSEELFECSSRFASHIIQKLTRSQRYVLAIDMMYKCAKIAEELGYFDDFEKFFRAYREIWIQFEGAELDSSIQQAITSRINRLQNGECSLHLYQTYLETFRALIEQIKIKQTTMEPKYAYYIVISHLHMLNNRLGISPEFEFLFSDMFVKTEVKINV